MGERLRLYHTGFHELRAPDITVGRKNADFGRGFYLSGSDAFAGKWARASRGRTVYVNAYELDLAGLTVLRFGRDADWFDYFFPKPPRDAGRGARRLRRGVAARDRGIPACDRRGAGRGGINAWHRFCFSISEATSCAGSAC